MKQVVQPITEPSTSKITSLLVTQAKPDEKSPYFELSKKFNLSIDFVPFIEIRGLPYKDFFKQKINIVEHSAIIFTSRNAIDHFFRICKEARIEVTTQIKYFCITEQTANYLQKYIVLKKRKVFFGERSAADLLELIKKHSSEKFLFPCSDKRRNDIPGFMNTNDLDLTEAIMYETISSDIQQIAKKKYDVIVFFSPSGIDSLFDSFPKFKQNSTRIACFGPTTAQRANEMGLTVDIQAPLPNVPSMTGALEAYIKNMAGN